MISNLNALEDSRNIRGLPWMVAITQVIGIAMIVMIGVWLNTSLGGFAWDGTSKEFNLHPLCMVCGMVFLYGEAALVYRVFRQSKKLKAKLIHAGLLLLAFVATIVGLVAVFQFHNANKINNLYSLHSWCGIMTVIFFGFQDYVVASISLRPSKPRAKYHAGLLDFFVTISLNVFHFYIQYILGFVSFLFPGVELHLRTMYLPLHQFFGTAVLVLAGITAISGINEKLFFVYSNGSGTAESKRYVNLPGGAVFGNLCGLVIIAFIVCVLLILHKTEWKRPQNPEEELFVQFRPVTTHGYDTDD